MEVSFKFNPKKSLAAIELLVDKGIPDLTKGKIDKLLFFADKRHLVQYGRPITGDRYAALPHGPIPSAIHDLLDAFENGSQLHPEAGKMTALFSLDTRFEYPRLRKQPSVPKETLRDHLSESDIEVLVDCANQLGSLSFSQLRSISHDQPAYTNAWAGRGAANRNWMKFEDFFEDDPDSLAGVKQDMIEDFMLHRAYPEPQFD